MQFHFGSSRRNYHGYRNNHHYHDNCCHHGHHGRFRNPPVELTGKKATIALIFTITAFGSIFAAIFLSQYNEIALPIGMAIFFVSFFGLSILGGIAKREEAEKIQKEQEEFDAHGGYNVNNDYNAHGGQLPSPGYNGYNANNGYNENSGHDVNNQFEQNLGHYNSNPHQNPYDNNGNNPDSFNDYK